MRPYDAGVSGRARRVAMLVAAIITLSPVLRAPTSDSYPLSTYPMFARDRGAQHWLPAVVAIDADGLPVRLSPELIAGTDEPVLASVTVSRAIRSGTADQLCADVARRLDDGRRVEVRREQHDVVATIADGAGPLAVDVVSACGGSDDDG